MNGVKSFDGFYLDDQGTLDDQIQFEIVADASASRLDRHSTLTLHLDVLKGQLTDQAVTIDRLEKPWSELLAHSNGAGDYLVGQSVDTSGEAHDVHASRNHAVSLSCLLLPSHPQCWRILQHCLLINLSDSSTQLEDGLSDNGVRTTKTNGSTPYLKAATPGARSMGLPWGPPAAY
jgi:hypothetical protein